MIKKRKLAGKLEINLLGPEGNAFVLIGYAKCLSDELGRDFKPIQTKMMSGDYENLIKVFDEEFGDFVIIYR